jgi:hypothetical protein
MASRSNFPISFCVLHVRESGRGESGGGEPGHRFRSKFGRPSSPVISIEFEKCWQVHKRPVGDSWRCDETYLKMRAGEWVYL